MMPVTANYCKFSVCHRHIHFSAALRATLSKPKRSPIGAVSGQRIQTRAASVSVNTTTVDFFVLNINSAELL